MPRVLIFRDHLMCPSETFIQAQAGGLRRYEPWYLCSRVFGSGPASESTIVLNSLNRFNLAEIAFKTTGWAPGLRRRIAMIRPSLVHAHFGTDGLRVLPVAKAIGLPLIVTYHGFDATASDEALTRSFPAARKYAKHRAKLMNSADCFIAASKFIASKLVEQGFAADRIRQHYIGIDAEFFSPDLSIVRSNLVLFVGRLVTLKGCEDLIRAMVDVQQAIPDTQMAVIGDGPLRQYLESMAGEALQKYCFLGTQSPAGVREWMKRAKVLCVPSKRDISGAEEGFGMVFAEAQAMGTPVVSYAIGGIPEAVCHGVTGLLAPEDDQKILAEHIIRLLSDESMRTKFANAARDHVLRNFDIRKQSAKLEDIYDEVLRSRREGSGAHHPVVGAHTGA